MSVLRFHLPPFGAIQAEDGELRFDQREMPARTVTRIVDGEALVMGRGIPHEATSIIPASFGPGLFDKQTRETLREAERNKTRSGILDAVGIGEGDIGQFLVLGAIGAGLVLTFT